MIVGEEKETKRYGNGNGNEFQIWSGPGGVYPMLIPALEK